MKAINNISAQKGLFSRVRQNVYPLFWFISAADENLLVQCTVVEQDKQASIGVTILCTSFAAILSSYYAVHSLFTNIPLSLLIAIFWGIIIFNLDRFMVGSIRKDKQRRWWKELIVASPRIILAFFIAILISKPLEVKIFHNQIEEARTNFIDSQIAAKLKFESGELSVKQSERNEARIYFDQVKSESNNLKNDAAYMQYKNDYDNCIRERNRLNDKISLKLRQRQQAIDRDDENGIYRTNQEIEKLKRQLNTLGCALLDSAMRKRKDAFYRVQEENLSSARQRLNKLTSIVDTASAALDTMRKAAGQTLDAATSDILGQLRVLNSLKERDSGVMWAGLMITMLFMILEVTPLLVKILSPRGEYDTLIAIAEKQASDNEEAADEESNQKKIARKKAAFHNSMQVGEIDEKVKNQIQEKILNAQAELAEKIVEAWKQQEEAELKSNSIDYLNNIITKTV